MSDIAYLIAVLDVRTNTFEFGVYSERWPTGAVAAVLIEAKGANYVQARKNLWQVVQRMRPEVVNGVANLFATERED